MPALTRWRRRLCHTGDMHFEVLFTGIPVSDFKASRAWYERFFGRPADIVAHEEEVMWRVTDGGWLYIVSDTDRAGKSIAALAVADIEDVTSSLEAHGIATGPIEPAGEASRKAVVLDPDGNAIAVIQVATGG